MWPGSQPAAQHTALTTAHSAAEEKQDSPAGGRDDGARSAGLVVEPCGEWRSDDSNLLLLREANSRRPQLLASPRDSCLKLPEGGMD